MSIIVWCHCWYRFLYSLLSRFGFPFGSIPASFWSLAGSFCLTCGGSLFYRFLEPCFNDFGPVLGSQNPCKIEPITSFDHPFFNDSSTLLEKRGCSIRNCTKIHVFFLYILEKVIWEPLGSLWAPFGHLWVPFGCHLVIVRNFSLIFYSFPQPFKTPFPRPRRHFHPLRSNPPGTVRHFAEGTSIYIYIYIYPHVAGWLTSVFGF